MPEYLSPGVYVEEVPPLARPIVGVSSSTAGFIGCFPEQITIPQTRVLNESISPPVGSSLTFGLSSYPAQTDVNSFTIRLDGVAVPAKLQNDYRNNVARIVFDVPPSKGTIVTADYIQLLLVTNEPITQQPPDPPDKRTFQLGNTPVNEDPGSFTIVVDGSIDRNAKLKNDTTDNVSLVILSQDPSATPNITATYFIKDPDLVEKITNETATLADGMRTTYSLIKYPVQIDSGTFSMRVNGRSANASLKNDDVNRVSQVTFDIAPASGAKITGDYTLIDVVNNEVIGVGDGLNSTFDLDKYPVLEALGTFTILVNNKPADPMPQVRNDATARKAIVDFTSPPGNTAPANGAIIKANYAVQNFTVPTGPNLPKLCTNFGDFTKAFGDFSLDPGQRNLAHAVFGFFQNKGSRCYVIRPDDDMEKTLEIFAGIDEIAMVAAPGITDNSTYASLIAHCQNCKDRVAILDSLPAVETDGSLDSALLDPKNPNNILPQETDYAALYFPWLQVDDPATKLVNPDDSRRGLQFIPPSGHVAGLYANTDATRGVFKAPANDPAMLGVLGLKYALSAALQDGLNPQGVNCIRQLNGAIRVWGARTVGAFENDFPYISTRRYFNYLRKSIDQGTQFVVFEPNTPALWERIKRSVGDFLLNEWRNGALFGVTPKSAFYVTCDQTTNPPEVIQNGQVITEVGVAIVQPAEFVIFHIEQLTSG